MSKQNMHKENIELSLPVNAAYVSAARLTASSIANRLGFDIDEIEDIKAAVSEACTYVIKRSNASRSTVFKLVFYMDDGFLEIRIAAQIEQASEEQNDEMGLLMVKALMDQLNLMPLPDGQTEMIMLKSHKTTHF